MAKYLRYFVPVGKEVILGRIRQSIESGTMPDGKTHEAGKIDGWVSGSTFRIWVGRRPSRNPAQPILRGSLEEVEGGTLIQARLGWTTFAIGMAIVSTTAIIAVIGFELAGHHVMSKEGKSGSETVVPLVFVLLLMTGFFSLGSVLARPQEDQLCNWLSQVSSSGEAR